MKNDEILTVKETAVLLKTTRQQVRKMIANEELPAVRSAGSGECSKRELWNFLR